MTTRPRCPNRRTKARGVSTLGAIAVLAMVLTLGYAAVRGLSTLSEYLLVEALVKKVSVSSPATDREAREAFDRQRSIDGIEAVQGSDLEIQRQGGQVVISFRYEKTVRLFGPVSLLIEYRGSSSDL